MANPAPELNTARSRFWRYGPNLVLMVIVVVVLVGLLDFLAVRGAKSPYLHWDWTFGGSNSLSPKTKKLLADIDRRIDDNLRQLAADKKPMTDRDRTYQLAALPSGIDTDSAGRNRDQQVTDLLANYARASRHIAVMTVDPEGKNLIDQIRERYAGEIEPYSQAIDGFEPLLNKLEVFFKKEAGTLGETALQTNLAADDKRELLAMQSAFSTGIPEALARTRKEVRRITTDAATPDWTKATTHIKTLVGSVLDQLNQIAQIDPKIAPKGLQPYLTASGPLYKQMADEVAKYKDQVDKLQPLKIDDVLSSIQKGSVVVLAPNSVRVIDATDMYKPQRGGDLPPDAPSESFQGEQAVSTALLALAVPDKIKVVFVSTSPQQVISTSYSAVADALRGANFDVSEWSPPGPPRPDQPPTSDAPAASGNGVVWVVFPPEAPASPQMWMTAGPPDAGPLVAAVKKHMDTGGSVLFLAQASGGPMAGMGGDSYAFADLLRPFGVEVKSKYTVVKAYPTQGGETRVRPEISFTRFPNHDITNPLQSLQTVFLGQVGQMGAMGGPTIVEISPAKPADVTAEVIIESERADTVWATANYISQTATKFDPKNDLTSPLPMGVAAARKTKDAAGKPLEERIVVLGNKFFAINDLIEAQNLEIHNGMPVIVSVLPGNSELFLNTIYWLAKNENMIAVGPSAGAGVRIRPMGRNEEIIVRASAFLVPPILAIVFGAIIFIRRRRA